MTALKLKQKACPVRPTLMPDGKIPGKKTLPDMGFMINPSIMQRAV
jgi:hypothetical protein